MEDILRGFLGLASLIAICYLFSSNRRRIDWPLVGIGVFAQMMFVAGVLNINVNGFSVFWPVVAILLLLYMISKIRKKEKSVFKWSIISGVFLFSCLVIFDVLPNDIFRIVLESISNGFVSLIGWSHHGTEFLFGPLADQNQSWGFIFAVQVLPNIIFFAALSSVLYYLGILQKIVYVFAYLLNKLNVSGPESLSTAANIFLGQTEAPIMIRPYLDKMNRSEILCIMIGGMANTAGSVLAAYVSLLGGTDIDQQHYFALHMLSQSIMSAPAAIVCSKILFPQTDHDLSKELNISKEKLGSNILDALSIGTTDGLKLAVNVGAMLVAFTAMVWVVNGLMDRVSVATGLDMVINNATDGRYTTLSMQFILGYIFAPLAWLIGVPNGDILSIGQLLGEKTILNEFYAYGTLGTMKANNLITDPKSILIATYALCGFANFASIGIQIGGISQLAPGQRKNLTELSIKALIGGTVATLMSATIAGMFFNL